MEIHQLRYFIAVAEYKHFTKAAEALHIAQPSVSQQIQKLEAELGSPLLHRMKRGVTLTEAGQTFLPWARRIVGDLATARAEVAELASLQRGSLAIGATPSLATRFLPAVTATLPEGWAIVDDTPTYHAMRPKGDDAIGVYLFRDPVAASQDPSCPDTPEPDVGTTAAELGAWMSKRPGLVASEPLATSVGGLKGVVLDLGIRDGWARSCSFAGGAPTVPLLVSRSPGLRWVVVGDERLRIHLLDLPSGGRVALDIDAFAGGRIDELLRVATPIVSSLRFSGT